MLRLNNRAASGEFGAASGVVRRRRCAGGFSLMEVLFAVVILTLGLVFVAANFPLGIMNASKVAESTRTIIDAHNAEVMVELQLDAIVADPCTHPNYSLEMALDCSSYTKVRLLPKPNVLLDYYPPRVMIDNPEGDPSMGTVEGNAGSIINWLFWSDDKGKLFTDDYLGDIGPIVSPPVDISDREVQKILQADGYDPIIPSHFFDYLQPAIFEVSMERKNSWCVLYRQLRPNTKEFCFYVFTLRSLPNLQYAMQGDFVSALSVEPQGIDTDRRFPVPWRIDLGVLGPAYWGDPDWDHTPSIQDPFYNDRFIVPEELARLLQTGSILIDRVKGHQFEVVDVYFADDNGQWYVRVSPSLELWMTPGGGPMKGVMGQFWFFPPPIVRTGPGDDDYIFEGKQPVVKVTRKIMKFK